MTSPDHAPLYALADVAPELPVTFLPEKVEYPFSNDDSLDSLEEAYERVNQPSYNNDLNNVALIMGEGALSTAIMATPEKTIVLIDKNPHMALHMRRYVDYFRISEDDEDWLRNMGLYFDSTVMSPDTRKDFALALEDQIQWWNASGKAHALDGPEIFQHSKEHFQAKAIIPWHADITNTEDMQTLGDHLHRLDAQITFLNLTNAIPTNTRLIPNASVAADMLSPLPIVADAPILTFSPCPSRRLASKLARVNTEPLLQPTGPFYGLEDLRTRGGDSIKGPVARPIYRQGRPKLA